MQLSDYMAGEGLTDDHVAAIIGRSRTTVSRIRRGIVRPDWETMIRISDMTNRAVNPDDFLPPPASPTTPAPSTTEAAE